MIVSCLKEVDHDESNLPNLIMNQHPGNLTDLSPDELTERLFDEWALVGAGAGVGGGFDHTGEFRVMNCRQAMKGGDAEEWNKAVEEEYQKFK